MTGVTTLTPAERLSRMVVLPSSMSDAIVSYRVSIRGTFSSDTEMAGEQEATVSCAGSDCQFAPAVLGTELPCSYSIAFTGRYFPS